MTRCLFQVFELTATTKTKRKSCQILDFFRDLGICDSELVFSEFKTQFRVAYYSKSKLLIQRLEKQVKKNFKKAVQIQLRQMERGDWLDKWKESYKPFRVGKRFWIVPAWENPPQKSTRHLIHLDPGAAFGSGRHETTSLTLLMLEKINAKLGNCLDVGTGTGVLAIALHRLGAENVTAFDPDPLSMDAARKNFELNHCTKIQTALQSIENFRTKKPFDLILANLHSKALIANQKKLASLLRKQEGILIVSGILKRHHRDFLSEFQPPKLALKKVLLGRSWVSISYQFR